MPTFALHLFKLLTSQPLILIVGYRVLDGIPFDSLYQCFSKWVARGCVTEAQKPKLSMMDGNVVLLPLHELET